MSLRSFGRGVNQGEGMEMMENNTGDVMKPSPRRNYTQMEINAFDPKRELQRIQTGERGHHVSTQGNVGHGDTYGRYEGRGQQHGDSRGKMGLGGYGSKGTLPTGGEREKGKNLKLIASSYYNESREPSPYRTLNEPRTRGNYGMMQHQGGSGQFREASKNSRSSLGRGMRSQYGMSPSVRGRSETQQISGISSKL